MKNSFKQEQKKEAIKRLKTLSRRFSIAGNLVGDYEKGIIKCTYGNSVIGTAVRDITPNSRLSKIIADFEEKYDDVVYYTFLDTICYCGTIMTLFSMLCVSKYREDWEAERYDSNYDSVAAYVQNMTYKDLSEFGDIGVNADDGKLIKVW